MNRRRLSALLTGFVLLALLVALLAPAAGAQKRGQRIVALTPFAANTLARLGVTPIAVGQTLGGANGSHPKLHGVPILKLSHPLGPNLEQLTSLRPSLVLSSNTWAKGNEAMEQLGIRVESRDPRSIAGALADTYKIGETVGRKHYARELLETDAGADRGRRVRGHPPSEGDGDPRRRPRPVRLPPQQLGGSIIRAAGGELATGGATSGSGFQRISDEVVIAENPDVIIAVPHADPEDIPALTKYLKNDPAWSSTKAAKNGHLYVSVDNSLLQAGTDIARTITRVRESYLHN